MQKNKHNYYNIKKTILNECSELIGYDVSLEQNLVDILDSLDQVSLIMKMEEGFDICIQDVDAEKFFNKDVVTIDNIVDELKDYGVIDINKKRKEKISKINSEKK